MVVMIVVVMVIITLKKHDFIGQDSGSMGLIWDIGEESTL